MNTTSPGHEQFVPHFFYHEGTGMLQVILSDRSLKEVMVSDNVDILKDANAASREEEIVGFNLWGARAMFHTHHFAGSTITLLELVTLFDQLHKGDTTEGVFGTYKNTVYDLARKYPLVWEIPEK